MNKIYILSSVTLGEEYAPQGRLMSRTRAWFEEDFVAELMAESDQARDHWYECRYEYLVIEAVTTGMVPKIEEYQWYSYNDETEHYEKCEKPEELSNVFCFGFG